MACIEYFAEYPQNLSGDCDPSMQKSHNDNQLVTACDDLQASFLQETYSTTQALTLVLEAVTVQKL